MKRGLAGILATALAGLLVVATPAMAVDAPCTGSCTVAVTATVPSGLTFNVTIVELIPNTATTDPADTIIGQTVTAMAFGNLASNGTFTPTTGPNAGVPQPRALNSTKAFQAFFGVNAQQRAFTIKQTAAPLQSGGNVIPAGAFRVDPLNGVGGDLTKPLPAGILVGPSRSAIGTGFTLFSSTGGPSNTMAATYGITDNPQLESGTSETIPLDQPAGSYSTVITYTATVI